MTKELLIARAEALEKLYALHKDSQVGTGIKASALLLARDYRTQAAALPVSQVGEPVAWMWQHDETGMTGFVQHDTPEHLADWERINRPRSIVAPLYTTPTPAGVPAGWKLVPVDPTEAMLLAARNGWPVPKDAMLLDEYEEEEIAEQWTCMLAAAPQPSES